MNALSSQHWTEAIYDAILLAVHGFLQPRHPGCSFGITIIGTERALIFCTVTWHTLRATLPTTEAVMQAIQDTVQLIVPGSETQWDYGSM